MNGILNDNDSYAVSNLIQHQQDIQHQETLVNILTEGDLIYVKAYNLIPFKDGDSWCVLLGENLQEGISGFGETPLKAIQNFNASFNKN